MLLMQPELKAKLACRLARCLLPVEIVERCGLATGPATAIFIALLIINEIQCYWNICYWIILYYLFYKTA